MSGFIARWIISALALVLTAYIIEGVVLAGFLSALVVVLVLGILNSLIRPILLLLTLPLNILTLGLFTFVINALMLYITASIVKGFEVDGFFSALFAVIVLSVISALANRLIR